jgi:hypothetical protein
MGEDEPAAVDARSVYIGNVGTTVRWLYGSNSGRELDARRGRRAFEERRQEAMSPPQGCALFE